MWVTYSPHATVFFQQICIDIIIRYSSGPWPEFIKIEGQGYRWLIRVLSGFLDNFSKNFQFPWWDYLLRDNKPSAKTKLWFNDFHIISLLNISDQTRDAQNVCAVPKGGTVLFLCPNYVCNIFLTASLRNTWFCLFCLWRKGRRRALFTSCPILMLHDN